MSRKAPTKFERERFGELRRIGCIACLKDGHKNDQIDIHHLTEGGRRVGHDATLPLCPWHHRGVVPFMPYAVNQRHLHQTAPSLAVSRYDFERRYGTQKELLAEVNELIGVAA